MASASEHLFQLSWAPFQETVTSGCAICFGSYGTQVDTTTMCVHGRCFGHFVITPRLRNATISMQTHKGHIMCLDREHWKRARRHHTQLAALCFRLSFCLSSCARAHLAQDFRIPQKTQTGEKVLTMQERELSIPFHPNPRVPPHPRYGCTRTHTSKRMLASVLQPSKGLPTTGIGQKADDLRSEDLEEEMEIEVVQDDDSEELQ
eukprot:4613251-Amphidinium_carterae.1